MKEAIISTSHLNSYGCRVLTEGIDLGQYKRNPVLLYMHRRCYDGKTMPIGRIERLRVDGDQLIGTPVFDMADEFAKQVASKWENGFLKMLSAGIEIIETSTDTSLLLPGQTRATITRCRLEEVSIVDIGANDDAVQLTHEGKVLTLSAGTQNDVLPLLTAFEDEDDNANKLRTSKEEVQSTNNHNLKPTLTMNKETLTLLGLGENATDQEVHDKVLALTNKAKQVEQLELAAVTSAVNTAIAEKRISEAQRDHFMKLGKQIGASDLSETLRLMTPAVKPSQVINQENGVAGAGQGKQYAKLSEVPADKMDALKQEQPEEYARLYKAEYGVDYRTL